MKYLNDYTQDATSKTLKNNGAFFCFNDKQFNEQKTEGVKYVHLYGGLIAPKSNVKALLVELDKVQSIGIAQDVKDNGIKAVIWRELANFESQISISCEDTINALQDYPITENEIRKQFKLYMDHCVKNDLF